MVNNVICVVGIIVKVLNVIIYSGVILVCEVIGESFFIYFIGEGCS